MDEQEHDYFAWMLDPAGGAATAAKDIGDGLCVSSHPLLFHWTVRVSEIGNRDTYLDRWCFATRELAETAVRNWVYGIEPTGWHRHPATGRRRPDGDPTREYVNF